MKQLNKFFLFALMFSPILASAQGLVKGTVTSKKDGQPLLGVSVTEEGTTNGVTTNFDGKYSIEVGGGRC